MTPYARRALPERATLEPDVDSPQEIQNQLAQILAARERAASPAPVITQHEESRIAANVAKLAAATRVFNDKVPDHAQPLDFFQTVRAAGLLEERPQVGAD